MPNLSKGKCRKMNDELKKNNNNKINGKTNDNTKQQSRSPED